MPVSKHIVLILFAILLSCMPSLMYACSKHMAQATVPAPASSSVTSGQQTGKSCCKKAASARKHCDRCARSGCGKTCHCAPYMQQYILLTSISFRSFSFKTAYSNTFKPFVRTFLSSDYSSIWTPPKIG